jgi:hypothetical protein
MIGAASPEEIQEFMTSTTRIVGQNIPTFTGERSGRFTEPERALTTEVTALAKAMKSVDQAVGALKGMLKLGFLDREFRAFEASNGQSFFSDVTTVEGAAKVVATAMRNGFTEDEALDLLQLVGRQQRELTDAKDFFLGAEKKDGNASESD